MRALTIKPAIFASPNGNLYWLKLDGTKVALEVTCVAGDGTLMVWLKRKGLRKRNCYVSIAFQILISYVDKPEGKRATVHYKDGNPFNTALENLSWQ